MDCIRFSPGESICRGYCRGEYPAHIARPNRCVNRERDQFWIVCSRQRSGAHPILRLKEMASVPDPPSVPSAERERRIKKTNQVRRLKNARNWKFESISLQRRVRLSPAATFERQEPG